LTGCILFGTGGHGSVKSYKYPVQKNNLETSIKNVIENNPNLYVDTIGAMIISPKAGGGVDTIYDHGYNDGSTYIKIQIATKLGLCQYTFRFSGDEKDWKISDTSSISLVSAFNENKEGGSEATGYDKKVMQYLILHFESELISELEKKMQMN
tara:strand:+ start:7732 stop:8190 length:459 start_codon:yes stop_codon:yes gene_type:complete